MVTGERVSIGSQPEPGRLFGPAASFLYLLLPQRAWLEGSELTVERQRGAGQCDLATASRTGPDWILLTADHLRMLAHVIGSRSAEPAEQASKVVRRLNDLASHQELRTKPIDWSFLTGPRR